MSENYDFQDRLYDLFECGFDNKLDKIKKL